MEDEFTKRLQLLNDKKAASQACGSGENKIWCEPRQFSTKGGQMADRWVIAYDVDTSAAAQADVTIMTVYNRIRACLRKHGFEEFTQLSIYAMPDSDNALVRVYQALQALSKTAEQKYIKRLHVFKIDGALNDVLPIVANRPSEGADGDDILVAKWLCLKSDLPR